MWAGAVVALTIVGSGAFVYYTRAFLEETQTLAEEDPVAAGARLVRFLRVFSGASLLLSVAGVAYCGRTAERSWRAKRFPPPGAWVHPKAPVQTETQARLLAGTMWVLTVLLAIFSVTFAVALWLLRSPERLPW